MITKEQWEHKGYYMRSSCMEDMEEYYQQGFVDPDPEGIRMSGSLSEYPKEKVFDFFLACIDDPNRYDFLIFDPNDTIIGECVINEIDWTMRSANFRIYLFSKDQRGKGIGNWAITTARDFAFSSLHLHRLSLDVFSFNTRAYQAYLKAGYQEEGRLRGAIYDQGCYYDDILMSILEDEWRILKEKRSCSTLDENC